MNFLTAIINALVGFVQRNPLTVLVILILAIAAPALLKGVALFFLYVVMSILILAVALILVFRWRMNKVRRQMEEQFGEGFDPDRKSTRLNSSHPNPSRMPSSA